MVWHIQKKNGFHFYRGQDQQTIAGLQQPNEVQIL